MFYAGFQDPDFEVALQALTACSSYIIAISTGDEVALMAPVIEPLLTLVNRALTSNENDVVVSGLEVIQECTCLDKPIINNYVEVNIA
jgi:hypothetical protein